MIDRPFWAERLAAGWKQAPIVWLTGPRRAGKTVLAQSLPDTEFLNCDLPSVAERLRDPESFYRPVKKRFVVFDEVHQLPDPSRLLKIGADGFPGLKILATGSSTLAATQKFRDSLTGRKRVVELVPVLHEELPAFGIADAAGTAVARGLAARVARRNSPTLNSTANGWIPTLRATCRSFSGWKNARVFCGCWNCCSGRAAGCWT